MQRRLEEKFALITGNTNGIGEEAAELLALGDANQSYGDTLCYFLIELQKKHNPDGCYKAG